MISTTTTKHNLNLSLLQKAFLSRRNSTEGIYPLSLVIIDMSSPVIESSLSDIYQNRSLFTIMDTLNNFTRKSDIKRCIHKNKIALLLLNTSESSAFIVSERVRDELKKTIGVKKNNKIKFRVSTHTKTPEPFSASKII